MKITAFILFTTCLQVAARSNAQTVTLSLKNVSAQKVFKEISRQTGVSILYNEAIFKGFSSITIRVKDATISEALDKCLKDQPFRYSLEGGMIVIKKKPSMPVASQSSGNLPPPPIEIKGNVKDDKGNPIKGVSVYVKGNANLGTSTDENGNFQLSVPDNVTTLVFSYVGYTQQEIPVNSRSVINIAMVVDTRELSNVVVTALGIKKEKKALGYAVQELGQKDLTEARDVNVANYLTGKIAGAQVSRTASGTGGSTRVIIRGISSLTGDNQPLYVVDGIPLDNSTFKEASFAGNGNYSGGHDFGDGIGNIDPQEIESMTVLKGPNATALYGSRGSNGVILITTKSGKAGKGIGVEINSGTTIEKVSMIPNVQNKYGPGYEDINVYGAIVKINGTDYETIPNWHSGSYGPPMNGQLYANPFVFSSGDPLTTFALSPQPKNNIRDFWETGLVTNNAIALSGGTEKSSARLAVNNTTTKGITPNHTGNQQSINLRVSTKLGNKLSFDAKVNYIHKEVNNAPNIGTSQENILWALTELGRYVPLTFLKEYYEKTGLKTRFPGVRYNPYYIVNELKNNAVRDRVVSFVSAKYQFNSWLSLMARSGMDVYSERRRQTWPVGANFSENSAGRIIDETYLIKETNSDALLTASKSNLGNFSASLSLGASLLKRSNRLQGWDANTLKVRGIYDISNAKNTKPYYSLVEKELQSVYAAGQIGYKNYLFLDITGRNDWSSTLGTNNYSFFYPSVASSLIFTDAFKMHSKVLTFGKVRASYAEAGHDAGAYLTQSGYYLNPTPYNGQNYASQDNNIALYNLKNELKQSIEFGADLRFLNNRIGIDATYYKSNTKDQIVPVNISTASGYTTKVINAGNVQNQGIEISLNVNPLNLKNGFRWDMSFNFAKNQSKVIELAPGIETLPLAYGEPNTIEARIGQPYGNIIGYKFKRSPDGQKIVGDDGAYVKEDNVSVLGNVIPKWTGGLNNTFSFKGFTLNALVDFVQGNQITSYTKYKMITSGNAAMTLEGREHSRPLDGVVEKVDATGKITYEKNSQTVDGQTYWARRGWDRIGEEFVMDGSYVMLREVILGYAFQPSFIKKARFAGIRISLVGRNLFFIKDHMQGMGISPETILNTQAASSGIETLSMPTTRNYGINFNFTF